jgi:hypothetical protein
VVKHMKNMDRRWGENHQEMFNGFIRAGRCLLAFRRARWVLNGIVTVGHFVAWCLERMKRIWVIGVIAAATIISCLFFFDAGIIPMYQKSQLNVLLLLILAFLLFCLMVHFLRLIWTGSDDPVRSNAPIYILILCGLGCTVGILPILFRSAWEYYSRVWLIVNISSALCTLGIVILLLYIFGAFWNRSTHLSRTLNDLYGRNIRHQFNDPWRPASYVEWKKNSGIRGCSSVFIDSCYREYRKAMLSVARHHAICTSEEHNKSDSADMCELVRSSLCTEFISRSVTLASYCDLYTDYNGNHALLSYIVRTRILTTLVSIAVSALETSHESLSETIVSVKDMENIWRAFREWHDAGRRMESVVDNNSRAAYKHFSSLYTDIVQYRLAILYIDGRYYNWLNGRSGIIRDSWDQRFAIPEDGRDKPNAEGLNDRWAGFLGSVQKAAMHLLPQAGNRPSTEALTLDAFRRGVVSENGLSSLALAYLNVSRHIAELDVTADNSNQGSETSVEIKTRIEKVVATVFPSLQQTAAEELCTDTVRLLFVLPYAHQYDHYNRDLGLLWSRAGRIWLLEELYAFECAMPAIDIGETAATLARGLSNDIRKEVLRALESCAGLQRRMAQWGRILKKTHDLSLVIGDVYDPWAIERSHATKVSGS